MIQCYYNTILIQYYHAMVLPPIELVEHVWYTDVRLLQQLRWSICGILNIGALKYCNTVLDNTRGPRSNSVWTILALVLYIQNSIIFVIKNRLSISGWGSYPQLCGHVCKCQTLFYEKVEKKLQLPLFSRKE